jgi:hypothetical protein
MICTPSVTRASVETLTLDPTQTVTGGTFDSMTVASVQLVVTELITQLVVSAFGVGFGWFGCALLGAGVNQPENNRPMVMVAMIINAKSIGLRLASFNTFSLMFLFRFQVSDFSF